MFHAAAYAGSEKIISVNIYFFRDHVGMVVLGDKYSSNLRFITLNANKKHYFIFM